jgi:hypothetical protein
MRRYGLHLRLACGLRRWAYLAGTAYGGPDELDIIYIQLEDENNIGSETDEELRKDKDKLSWNFPTPS